MSSSTDIFLNKDRIELKASGDQNTSTFTVDSDKGLIHSKSKEFLTEASEKGTISAKNDILIEAGSKICLKVGQSSIILKPSCIELSIGGSIIKLEMDGIEISAPKNVIKSKVNTLIKAPVNITLESLKVKVE